MYSIVFLRFFEQRGGGFVRDEGAVGVAPKDARGEIGRDYPFHHASDGFRFVRADGEDQDLLRVHNVFRSHRKGAAGHFVDALEESCVHL